MIRLRYRTKNLSVLLKNDDSDQSFIESKCIGFVRAIWCNIFSKFPTWSDFTFLFNLFGFTGFTFKSSFIIQAGLLIIFIFMTLLPWKQQPAVILLQPMLFYKIERICPFLSSRLSTIHNKYIFEILLGLFEGRY